MKMDLIQPFINAADAVLSQGLSGTTKVGNLSMEEDAYRRKGVAGMVALSGDIEGRIILDLEPQTAVRVASHYAGAELPESDALIKETIFELANQVVGQRRLRAQRPGLPLPRASSSARHLRGRRQDQ